VAGVPVSWSKGRGGGQPPFDEHVDGAGAEAVKDVRQRPRQDAQARANASAAIMPAVCATLRPGEPANRPQNNTRASPATYLPGTGLGGRGLPGA